SSRCSPEIPNEPQPLRQAADERCLDTGEDRRARARAQEAEIRLSAAHQEKPPRPPHGRGADPRARGNPRGLLPDEPRGEASMTEREAGETIDAVGETIDVDRVPVPRSAGSSSGAVVEYREPPPPANPFDANPDVFKQQIQV